MEKILALLPKVGRPQAKYPLASGGAKHPRAGARNIPLPETVPVPGERKSSFAANPLFQRRFLHLRPAAGELRRRVLDLADHHQPVGHRRAGNGGVPDTLQPSAKLPQSNPVKTALRGIMESIGL